MKRHAAQFLASTVALASLLGVTDTARAQIADLNDAINKAGRQRMLSQRAAKSYLALGQKVRPDQADKTLAASIALFDRQLVELKSYAPSAEIRTTYVSLEAAWSDYKTALVGKPPSKADAANVLLQSEKVLALANRGTGQLEASAARPVGRLVNISGRQRMLSQRMAALYLGANWGVNPGPASAEIAKLKDEFLKAHELLKNAPEATGAIKEALELAGAQFTFFDAALRSLQPGAVPTVQQQADVFTTSERILQAMNDVTGMYAGLN